MSRPISDWNGFLGQRPLIGALRPIAEGAKANGRVMSPTMLAGPSGNGKSYLAQAVARHFGTNVHILVARADLKMEELVTYFKLGHAHDTMFVDEIHALQPALQEVFFEIIDNSMLPPVDGTAASPVERHKLPPLHLIAATDQPGKLLTPLKRRFGLTLHFGAYSARELDAITRQRATEFGMVLSPQAATLVARTSRGIPRLAGQRLWLLRDFYGRLSLSEFDLPMVRKFLVSLGVDNDGLTRQDRKYLSVALEQGDVGISLRTLAARLEIDTDSIFRDIEPFLMRQGLLAIQQRGRVLTASGVEYASRLKEKSS